MSTETLKYPHGGDPGSSGRMAVFFALSALIHILILLAAGFFSTSGTSLLERIFKDKEDNLIVDVVELPPSGSQVSKEKKPPTHYADRTQSVIKETYPEQVARAKKPSAIFVPGKGGAPGGGQALQEAKEVRGGPSAETKKQSIPPIEEKGHEKSDLLEPVKTGTDEGRTSKTATPQPGAGPKPQGRDLSKEGSGKPNLFLSEERLSELTKRYEAEAPKGEQGKTLQLNTSELRYQRYLIGMKDRIQLFWEYPDVAARNGWHGRLRIDFVINKDGTVSDIRLVKSSNYPVLDDAAITALKLASPFQPFPENFAIESILIRGSFEYSFYGNEGR